MLFEIEHITVYTYSSEVFFEPHYFRLKPKFAPHSTTVNFNIQIDPKPVGFSELLDSENNHLTHCWFAGTHRELRVSVSSRVEVQHFNPLNFLVSPAEYLQIPFIYDAQTTQLLQAYLNTAPLPAPMMQFAYSILQQCNSQTLPFLTELTRTVHQQFAMENREFGEPYMPAFTYQQKMGSCRDLSWMLIHLLRNLGIAARFVSGYFYLDVENPQFELHAWVEVYLPGAGWIAYDPSHGLVAGSGHIPLAASAFFSNTMPVSGAIRGDATSVLRNDLKIRLVS